MTAADWAQIAKLLASDPNALDEFGHAVAIDGDRLVVGAPFDDEAAPGAGAAYVLERDADGRWHEVAKLIASDAEHDWSFGGNVAIHGEVAAATATGADPIGLDETGAAYVFERDGSGTWRETMKLKAPDGPGLNWGSSVTIDGSRIVVGAVFEGVFPDTGAAYVFERDVGGPGNWGPVAKVKGSDGDSDDRFGQAAALDGDRLVVGARNEDDRGSNAGAAYVFDREAGGEWTESAKLIALDGDSEDNFGWSVDIDSETVVIGAYDDEDGGNSAGSAYVFERGADGRWREVVKLKSSDLELGDEFGTSVGIDQHIVIVGAPGRDIVGAGDGAAYVFERDHGGAGRWGEAAKLVAADPADADSFAFSVGSAAVEWSLGVSTTTTEPSTRERPMCSCGSSRS